MKTTKQTLQELLDEVEGKTEELAKARRNLKGKARTPSRRVLEAKIKICDTITTIIRRKLKENE
jgi:hypothetical protein